MGLYDNIKCNYPLDKKHIQDDLFQTKSLYCLLENYEIAEGGWLFKSSETGDMSELEEPELFRYTGKIRFYTMRERNYEDKKIIYWYEYSAYFKEGKLKEINPMHEKREYPI